MSCSTCTKTKQIIICGDEIIIAENVESNAAYGGVDIYIKDVTLEKIYRQSTVVGYGGVVVLDLTALAEGIFQPDHEYEIWVTETDAGIDNKIDLVYGEGSGAISVECLNVPFVRLYDGETDDADTITSQTIELAE